MKPIIKIFQTPFDLAGSLAIELADQVREAVKNNSGYSIALSGGSTPKLLFSVLTSHFAGPLNMDHVHIFWVDERCVPPDDAESNFGMTHKTLLSKIKIRHTNIHRIRGEEDPPEESRRYEKEIDLFVNKRNGLPCFNTMLLGLGEDGHTASIFPGDERLFSSEKFCVPAVHPVTGQKRITLTGNIINNSENVIFLVTGKSKAVIVRNILDGKTSGKHFPASFVLPANGRLFWYIDKEAGSLLKQS